MDLKAIRPKKVKFKIRSTGREYILRPFSLADEIWLEQEFGGDLSNIVTDEDINIDILSRILFNQIEDRSDFKTQDITIIDENGDETIEHRGGHKLLQRMIIGLEDKLELVNALMSTMVNSRPEKNEKEKNEKKKMM